MKREENMRERILDVAQELVQRVGANAMSYQHLSEALGITKPSIHYHFPSKADLLEQLVTRYSKTFLGVLDRIVATDEPGRARLEKYIALFEATLEESAGEKACPCGMLGAEAATLGQNTLAGLQEFYRGNEERLARILEEGRQDGSLRFTGDATATSALVFAALEGALMVSRVRGGVTGFRGTARQLLNLMEH